MGGDRATGKKAEFLTAYADMATVRHAAAEVGIARQTHYKWLEADEAYRADFAHARKDAGESLEREAVRRARDGWEEPVHYQGIQTSTVRKYSDTLLIFLLKGQMPDKYRDTLTLEGSEDRPLHIRRSERQWQPLPEGEVIDAIAAHVPDDDDSGPRA